MTVKRRHEKAYQTSCLAAESRCSVQVEAVNDGRRSTSETRLRSTKTCATHLPWTELLLRKAGQWQARGPTYPGGQGRCKGSATRTTPCRFGTRANPRIANLPGATPKSQKGRAPQRCKGREPAAPFPPLQPAFAAASYSHLHASRLPLLCSRFCASWLAPVNKPEHRQDPPAPLCLHTCSSFEGPKLGIPGLLQPQQPTLSSSFV